MRIIIGGGPLCGKTTKAKILGLPVRSTDEVMNLGWSEASAEVALWFDRPGPWIVEGVAVARALRKWLEATPTGKPCDQVIWLTKPCGLRSKGQETMAKGCETAWREILPELLKRGVEVR